MNRTTFLERTHVAGAAGWLWHRICPELRPQPRLAVLERISLAPRQSLALIEAEGRKLLIAVSAEGAAAFYPLDEFRSEHRTECQDSCAIEVRGCVW